MGYRKIDSEGGKLVQDGWATSAEKRGDRLWWYYRSLRRKSWALICIFLTLAIPENYFPRRELWFETVVFMLIEAGSFYSACTISIVFTATLTSKAESTGWNLRWLGRGRRGRTSDRSQLNGKNSSVVLGRSFSGTGIENCSPNEREGVTSGVIFVCFPVACKGEAGVSSSKAGSEGILEGEEIGERKVTIRLVERSKTEGVQGWKTSSGWEKTDRHKEEELSVVQPGKRIRTNLNRGDWSYSLVKLTWFHYRIDVLFCFLNILSHII